MGRKGLSLDLSPLVGRVGAVEEFEIPSAFIKEDDFSANVRDVRIRATNCGGSLQIDGSFSCHISQECSRCLGKFEVEVFETIAESIPISSPGSEDGEFEAEDEYDVQILCGTQLDVSELIRQQILIDLPMVPLCSEDCKGLCHRCGERKDVCACGEGENEEPKTELGRLLANAFKTDDEREDPGRD